MFFNPKQCLMQVKVMFLMLMQVKVMFLMLMQVKIT